MIERIIRYCATHQFLVILVTLAMVSWGVWALYTTTLDAIPDLSDVQVIVFTEWPGQNPQVIEDQVTYPIVTKLLAAPRVQYVRGQSMTGMSFVYAIFEDGTDIYWARSRVLEYMSGLNLPEGVRPILGPDATGVGWVFEYALVDESGKHSLAELRSFQDWYLRYWLESVEGVAQVATIGGYVKEYQVDLDPNKLVAYDLSVHDVIKAIRNSNNDVGGDVLEIAGHEHLIRGRGYVKSVEDLEVVPLKMDGNGTPVTVKDVADVHLGPFTRRGLAELDGKGEVVGGIVVMRYGQNALDVIDRVKARLAEVEDSLPEGAKVVTTYDRSDLILRSVDTLKEALTQEMIIVALVCIIFLWHFRSALIAVLMLPIGVLLAFIPMRYMGLTANIMSLGGIAVAIGEMVDAAIVLIENAHKRLERWETEGRPGSRNEVIISAFQEVGRPIFFALLVITVSFIPVFTLEAQEGRLFKPLAFTKTFSMAFGALLAITFTPALGVYLIRGRILHEGRHPISRLLIWLYVPVVRFALRFRWLVVGAAVVVMVATVPIFMGLESEFMPPLNEGVILYMPTAPPGISIAEAGAVLQAMDGELKEFPEVISVFGKAGSSQTPTDPAPLSMFETVVVLKPQDEWRPGLDWDGLIKEMDEKLRYPGMPNIWWMPVQTRTEMLATGIRSPLGIKVFGPDLAGIEQVAVQIEKAVQTVPGTRTAYADRVVGGFFLDFKINRREVARYGLTVGDVEEVIMTAIGGMPISQTVEGRERYPINVRYAREFRDDPEALKRVLVMTPTGAHVPLAQLADIEFVSGPSMILDEDGQLVGFVFVDVVGRPLVEYVKEAKQVVAQKVDLPPGYRLEWAGQFKYFERAKERLKLVVPFTLLIVFVLLYMSTESAAEMLMIVLSVPFAVAGGVWLLAALDYNLSVAVWVGLIALAGVAAQTGVVMLVYLDEAWERRKREGRRTWADLHEAIIEGAAQRLRPKTMTVATTVIGLLPLMLVTGTGADMMKRIAAPLVGGLWTSAILTLVVVPAAYALWKRRETEE